jgi:hypothetical protein
VESGLISLIYCLKVLMNLGTFPLTAFDALSSFSRLIFPSRAPTRKSTSSRRRAVSLGTLYGMDVVALAAAVGSAAFYALLRIRPLSISCAEAFVVISCGKVNYDKSG